MRQRVAQSAFVPAIGARGAGFVAPPSLLRVRHALRAAALRTGFTAPPLRPRVVFEPRAVVELRFRLAVDPRFAVVLRAPRRPPVVVFLGM